MLGLAGFPWIDPCLILALLVFVLMKAPMGDKRALWMVTWAFVSALIGSFFLDVSLDRGKAPVYVEYAEPVRLALTVVWFWISIEFFKNKLDFVVRWLVVSVTAQFCLACYLYAAMLDLVPVPTPVAVYLTIYKARQVLWFGDLAIYRMNGTFDESPPFGLFMFSCLVIFFLCLIDTNRLVVKRKWAIFGGSVSLIGAVAALSDQIFLGLLVFGVVWYFAVRRESQDRSTLRRFTEALVGIAILIFAGNYLAQSIKGKLLEAASASSVPIGVIGSVEGTSGAERAFHLHYGLGLLEEMPLAVFTGIGPGRYGDYAIRTGLFESTVTIQNMPLNWLVEYGLFGSGLIGLWLFEIITVARQRYGSLVLGACIGLLIASISQANWMWESWFLAWAFLSTRRESYAVPSAPAHRGTSNNPILPAVLPTFS
jgi:hypothetical protein